MTQLVQDIVPGSYISGIRDADLLGQISQNDQVNFVLPFE